MSRSDVQRYDVVVLGGGIAGLATAARLQHRGVSTALIESHGQLGGCAGFFRKRGFSFDVGATTLVDFEPGGAGGGLLQEVGAEVPLERLPGYLAWLPGATITIHRDPRLWGIERARILGDTLSHRRLFALLDELSLVFWAAARRGLALPIRSPLDVVRAAACLAPRHWTLARYLGWTLGDALVHFGLEEDLRLRALLGMLVQDTVNASVDEAPLVNASLGISIRGAGLCRAPGGMATFVTRLGSRYRELGGIVRVGTRVGRVTGKAGAFVVETSRGPMGAAQVVSALPLEIAARVAPPEVGSALRPYLERDRHRRGGALVAFLGVPEDQVSASAWTHHQILEDLRAPLGNGNNAFVSVSSPGDEASAPAGFRAVIISTHCELSPWTRLGESGYGVQKAEAFAGLLRVARRVYPRIAETYVVGELGTPTTYARYTGRPDGAVGGACLHLGNANQHAVPHEVGVRGFYLTGDGTWPGLGTVAACLASRDVARRVFHAHARSVGADAGRRRTWSAMKDSETAPCG